MVRALVYLAVDYSAVNPRQLGAASTATATVRIDCDRAVPDFMLGTFLGRVAGISWYRSGLQTLLVAVVTIFLIYLIAGV